MKSERTYLMLIQECIGLDGRIRDDPEAEVPNRFDFGGAAC